MKTKVYISGPMAGIPRQKYLQHFDQIAQRLTSKEYKPINPARGIGVFLYYTFGRKTTLLYDLWLLSRCKIIYMLTGWEQSEGAKLEKAFAETNDIIIVYEKQ